MTLTPGLQMTLRELNAVAHAVNPEAAVPGF